MAYIDKAMMILKFSEPEIIQLTDRDGSTHAIVDAVLDPAMLDAEAEVDSYLGSRYVLPLPSVPEILQVFTCDIARYRLYDDAAPAEVQRRYERAVSWLKDVSRGLVSLGIKAPDIEPVDSVIVVESRTQVFSDCLFHHMGPTW
jgi:phage gp36-like protein